MNRSFGSLGDMVMTPLQAFWLKIVNFLPQLIMAVVVLLIGLLAARLLSKLVQKVLETIKVDHVMEKVGVSGEFEKIGWKFSFSKLLADIVRIFFAVVTLVAVVDILDIPQLSQFLDKIVVYIPNVFVAIVILAIGIVVGRFFQDITEKTSKAANMSKQSVKSLGSIAKASVVVFSLMAALVHLGIAQSLIEILFTGFVAMVALAGGIAFGLGGKDTAADVLKKIDPSK